MKSPARKFAPIALAIAVLAGMFVFTPSQEASADASAGLLGSWRGGGTAKYTSGTERISCTAYYTGGGSNLGLAIRCSSASGKVEIRSKLSVSGSRVSGRWEERTYNASGNASGSLKPGNLNVRISGAVNGVMNISYSKSRQNVSISISGSKFSLRGVSVSLSRSG